MSEKRLAEIEQRWATINNRLVFLPRSVRSDMPIGPHAGLHAKPGIFATRQNRYGAVTVLIDNPNEYKLSELGVKPAEFEDANGDIAEVLAEVRELRTRLAAAESQNEGLRERVGRAATLWKKLSSFYFDAHPKTEDGKDATFGDFEAVAADLAAALGEAKS